MYEYLLSYIESRKNNDNPLKYYMVDLFYKQYQDATSVVLEVFPNKIMCMFTSEWTNKWFTPKQNYRVAIHKWQGQFILHFVNFISNGWSDVLFHYFLTLKPNFLICYLAAPWSTSGHYLSDSLTQPITALFKFLPVGHWEPCNEVRSLSPA